nr:Y-family DNA polymerase [Tellurirhabdus bombi]
MIAIMDCNNFYVSCERSFNPRLENRPVIVLSNNDGCVIARSNEAKELGVKMGTPYHEIGELIDAAGIEVFSSNYVLYGDMSSRVMSILARFVETVEVYSIDEAFLDLSSEPDPEAFCRTLRETISRWTRIPVSFGIAPTKTLAKVANRLAKKNPSSGGVLSLIHADQIRDALMSFPIGDLWGIGYRFESMLKRNEIKTAWELSQTDEDWVSERMTVNGLRLVYELRGVPVKMLELEPAKKKNICVAPSFGVEVHDIARLRMALATYLARASEKLRKQDSAASSITVFVHTNRFKKNAKHYYNSRTVILPHPSSSNTELLKYASAALDEIFSFGYAYQKLGVFLNDLVPDNHRQANLFTELPDDKLAKLSKAVDGINKQYGRDKVRLAAQGYDRTWPMKQKWLSRCYTTRWSDILVAS